MRRLFDILTRTLLAGLVWWALTDGAGGWDAWAVGVPAVAAAAALSMKLLAPIRWSWPAALRFAGYFLWESGRGGVDVAWRAFSPRMPLAPGLIRHELNVSPDLARAAVVNASSLLPGSLTVDLERGVLTIHTLDVRRPSSALIVASTERRIAAMFRLAMPASGGGEAREPSK